MTHLRGMLRRLASSSRHAASFAEHAKSSSIERRRSLHALPEQARVGIVGLIKRQPGEVFLKPLSRPDSASRSSICVDLRQIPHIVEGVLDLSVREGTLGPVAVRVTLVELGSGDLLDERPIAHLLGQAHQRSCDLSVEDRAREPSPISRKRISRS